MKGLPRSLARANPSVAAVQKVTIPINKTFDVTGVTGVAQFATAQIGGLPEGNILLLGAVAYLSLAGPGGSADLKDDFEGDFAIGTAPTADTTLNGAEVDIIASTAMGPATAEVIALKRATNGTQAILDNTDGSLEINLNIVIDADEVTDGETVAIKATGALYLSYVVLGDD
jgi:hypothetical protein